MKEEILDIVFAMYQALEQSQEIDWYKNYLLMTSGYIPERTGKDWSRWCIR